MSVPAAPMMTFIGATLTEARDNRIKYIKSRLATVNAWAVEALLVIHERQTHEEQSKDATIEANGIGFGSRDAEILTSFAKQVLAWRGQTVHQFPAPLSPNQFGLLKRLMPKYAAQLLKARPTLEVTYPVAKVKAKARVGTDIASAQTA